MGKKKSTSGLGKALVRDRFGKKSQRTNESFLHTSELNDGYEWGRLNLQSVTEQSTLEDFLSTAELAGTEFQAEKLNVTVVDPGKSTGLLSKAQEAAVKETQDKHRQFLSIPRRPKWDSSTTAEELNQAERDSFLEWRRKLAELQDVDGLVLTPFERNLDFWRQLWRVLERSDVVVQIVDARNPMLFYCEDVDAYAKEISQSKVTVLLINKADFLTAEQREYWLEYLTRRGLRVIFWSAAEENERNKLRDEAEREAMNTVEEEESIIETDDEFDEDDDEEDEEYTTEEETEEKMDSPEKDRLEKDKLAGAIAKTTQSLENTHLAEDDTSQETESNSSNVDSPATGSVNSADVVTGDELIDILKSLHSGEKYQDGLTTIGLVGYPNVGKSSTINALIKTKKVPVSQTPGRTKHFQTLYMEPTVMLCDCPGLVMPTFVSTKADMVVSGILPIDQMRDYVPPVSLVCRRIPRKLLELTYGIMLPKPNVDDGEDLHRPPTAHELLAAYACMRGYMTHKGIPDFQRASRFILKDFMNGKLLYCHPPQDLSPDLFRPTPELPQVIKVKAQESVTAPKGQTIKKYTSSIDQTFLAKVESGSGSRGIQAGAPPAPGGKPSKKHGNRNKKEKLRRLNKHLDA